MHIKNILKVYKYNKKNKIYETAFNFKQQKKEIKLRSDFNKSLYHKNNVFLFFSLVMLIKKTL